MTKFRITTWDEVHTLPIGSYVELRGTLTAGRTVRSPSTGEPVVGHQTLCSLFTKSLVGAPDFSRRVDRAEWANAVLTSFDGKTALHVVLEGGARVPAAHEDTLEGDKMLAVLHRLDIAPEGLLQLQVLERSVPDGGNVRLRGVLTNVAAGGSAFRSNARAQRGLKGETGRPLVIVG